MISMKRALLLFVVCTLSYTAAFAQDDCVDYGITISNISHKTDKGSVIISFDVSFSEILMGKTVTLGVKAYVNPYKLQDVDDIMHSCNCLNYRFEDVFSGKNLYVQHRTYRNVVLSVPRSAIRKAIDGYGKFRITFLPCVVYDNEIETFIQCGPRPVSYNYTFNPPSNSNSNSIHYFSRRTTYERKTADNYIALDFYPDGRCESNGYIYMEDGWPMRGSAKGSYYVQGKTIHITWEGDAKEVLYEQKDDQNLYQNGKIEYRRVRE